MLSNVNFKPKKYLGQNFLKDREVLKEITKAAEIQPDDIILEIGPGFGILTEELTKKAKKVIAIEKDERLVKILKEKFKDFKNIEIIQGDVLKLTTENLQLTTNYKVVANLPYYITSPVIRKFLETENPPKLMVLMVQKEVAQRICSKPPKMSLLSIACQLYSKPKIVKIIKKDCFWPKPKVDSAIIKLITNNLKFITNEFREEFFKIVKAGFSSSRKQLKNNLKKIFGDKTNEVLVKAGIDPARRAETLSVEDWMKIYNVIKS
ncbi:MAG TPA: 16S rRNA (adenine(1518)-N(6)/adenine(1519)-N(6))-dimethyltransferase RsmA [Candidatus Pacearchaeota archaeon]|nr:16S rRNA (adenine(1518)-N(6)/adenine(1519)-N(6))-dimethyltransferase RsmA [Candidatus Pacearchaeota archaeon]HOK93969.1 16S rRNA (adenine(1518)-N(6)/adenine(1519)-N(6))-dimethyltransferase RsmA [Candidatus Pacearchaeota archaeon]HPO75040.1 16S rRNA (adenine(1518)-N(6)/adenine(1519)-N(6))-dimethyltransferase RsmA [Candidatus Pacearchaeota archaeon]